MRKIIRPICPNPKPLKAKTSYKDATNKQALLDASSGKCMYCESKILDAQFGEVEHIKPKQKYPDSEFDWNNLGIACSKCNNCKRDKYDEIQPYIDPYSEDPEEHIVAIGALLFHKRGSERGELTINHIQLNRIDLIERRSERNNYIQKAIDACYKYKDPGLRELALKELISEGQNTKEYSLSIYALLKAHEII